MARTTRREELSPLAGAAASSSILKLNQAMRLSKSNKGLTAEPAAVGQWDHLPLGCL
jgi:hypothetical protein